MPLGRHELIQKIGLADRLDMGWEERKKWKVLLGSFTLMLLHTGVSQFEKGMGSLEWWMVSSLCHCLPCEI